MAVNIEAFTSLDTFRLRMDRIIREFRESRKAHGTERLYLPGELERDFEVQYRRDGIPLNDVTLQGLVAAAARVSLNLDIPH